jgi:hypothetical protein
MIGFFPLLIRADPTNPATDPPIPLNNYVLLPKAIVNPYKVPVRI